MTLVYNRSASAHFLGRNKVAEANYVYIIVYIK